MTETQDDIFTTFLPQEKREELISKSGEWILANVNWTGYYIVNYNPENWQRLLAQLEADHHVSDESNKSFTEPTTDSLHTPINSHLQTVHSSEK